MPKETSISTLSILKAKANLWTRDPRFIKRDRTSKAKDLPSKENYARIDDAHSKHAIVTWTEGDTLYFWSSAKKICLPPAADSLFTSLCSLEEIEEDLFDFSKVITANYLFFGCEKLKNITINNMTAVKDTSFMFGNCSALESVNYHNCSFENLQSAEGMYKNCTSMEEIDLSQFTADNLLSIVEFCSGCSNMKTVKMPSSCEYQGEDISITNLVNSIYNEHTKENDTIFKKLNELYEDGTPSNVIIDWLKRKDDAAPRNAKIIYEPKFSRTLYRYSLVTTAQAFMDCPKLELLDMSHIQLCGVEKATKMFENCGLSEEQVTLILNGIKQPKKTKESE